MFLTMAKVEIVGTKHDLDAVLGYIHQMGVLDIEDLTHKFESDGHIRRLQLDDATKAVKDRLEGSLVKMNSFITALEAAQVKPMTTASRLLDLSKFGDDRLLEAADKIISSIEDATQKLTTKKRELELEQANLGKYVAMFTKMRPLTKELVALKGFDNIMLLMDRQDIDILDAIKEALAELTHDQFQLIASEIDSETTAVMVVYNHNYAKQVQGFLWSQHVNEVRLPEDVAKLSYEQAMKKMERRREEVPRELEEAIGKLNTLAVKHGDKLVGLSRVMTDRVAEFQMRDHFGATDYTFVIQGWLPKKQVAKVNSELQTKFGSALILEILPVSEEERRSAPIKYSNKFAVRSFEPIMSVFGAPRYGSVDATPFVAFFFPLFFGVILGDMGYALVLLALAFWLRSRYKKTPIVQDIAMIVTLAGISSFFFGFIYGEFFGDLPHRLGLIREASVLGLGLPIDREKEVMGTLFMAIGLGAIQIFLGLSLGIINAARGGHRKHAIEKAGLLLTLLGFITIALGTQVALPLKTPGAVMLFAAVPLLLYGGGLLGILEILGMLGNVLSYARIMALGLVSVMLAKLANDTGMSLKGNIVLAILAGTLIHAVNLLIHVFTPSIHALRLNFVEFFGKFYEFGGREYQPFRRGGVE